MREEEIQPFLNKKVKLIKGNNFALTGYIREVNTDSILFETTQATALIDIDTILEIIYPKEGNNE